MTQPFDSDETPGHPSRPRKSSRIAIAAEVVLRRTGQGTYRVNVFDVSVHGCKAEFVERPKLEELVWIKFDNLQSLEAKVCWVQGFEVGLQFDRPIHPAVFEKLVQGLKT